MALCPLCGSKCDFQPGEVAVQYFSDTYLKFPISQTHNRYVTVVNPKCLYSYKANKPIIKGHDYICKIYNNNQTDTFPVTSDKLKKILDPNNILKEVIKQEKSMSHKENYSDFKQSLNKNTIKNKIKEKKRLEKERKKSVKQEEKSEPGEQF